MSYTYKSKIVQNNTISSLFKNYSNTTNINTINNINNNKDIFKTIPLLW